MNFKKLLVLAIFAIAIVGIIAPINASNIDNNVKIESKTKTSSYKITWNCNSGKIGTKKTVSTSVKKTSKIGKLLTPKRSGYTFNGWYTKKTGGTKITKNTVVKKKVTYYAQWKKGNSNSGQNTGRSNRILNAAEKELIGGWTRMALGGHGYAIYVFNNDGTFTNVVKMQIGSSPATINYWEGKWHVSGGTLYMNNLKAQISYGSERWEGNKLVLYQGTWEPYPLINPNEVYKNYKTGTDETGKYIQFTTDKYYK